MTSCIIFVCCYIFVVIMYKRRAKIVVLINTICYRCLYRAETDENDCKSCVFDRLGEKYVYNDKNLDLI